MSATAEGLGIRADAYTESFNMGQHFARIVAERAECIARDAGCDVVALEHVASAVDFALMNQLLNDITERRHDRTVAPRQRAGRPFGKAA